MTKKEQMQKIYIIYTYYYRLKAKNINVDVNELINKLSILPCDEITKFLSDLIKNEKNVIAEGIEKIGLKVTYSKDNKNIEENTSLQQPEIKEFTKDDNNYLKFRNKKRNIKIFKFFGDAKKAVSSILKKEKNDGNFVEVPLTNSADIDTTKYPKVQGAILKEIEKQCENKDLIVSMEENLYVAKDNESDTILTINNNNGHYSVKPLVQKDYQKEENSLNTKGKVKVLTNPNAPKLINDDLVA